LHAKKNLIKVFGDNLVWFLLVAAIFIMGIFNPVFLSKNILMNILVQSTPLGLLGIAMALALLIGEIDLSIIGTLGFTAVIGASMMAQHGHCGLEAFIAIMGLGAIIGLFNGWIITRLNVNALIGTLSVQLVLRGASLAFTRGRSIMGFTPGYRWLGQASFGSDLEIPVLIFVLIIAYLITTQVLKRTEFGRSLYAIGGNANAAYASGIDVKNIRMMAFVYIGLISAFAGYIISARMGVVTAKTGDEYLMYAIAAPVIGGVSIFGGVGKAHGILAGVLLITIIMTGLQIIDIPSFWVNFVFGIVILAAVIIDAVRHKFQTAE